MVSLSLSHLLIVAKEDSDRQPSITANLETLRNRINLLDLLLRQLPPIQLKVGLDAARRHALRDDAPALLEPPEEQDLLRGLALGLGNGEEGLVGVERRVCRAKTGVAGAVDALGGAVGDELGGRVARVQLNLVDSRCDLFFPS